MMQLLLISSASTGGTGFLEHCAEPVAELVRDRERVLFVPYALKELESYAARVRPYFFSLGLRLDSIHEVADPLAALRTAGAIFVGGGNSFRLLKALYDRSLLAPVREAVRGGTPYIGTSAGANLACPTIKTTNDMPIVHPPSLEALGLVPFNINPHYRDPAPGSTYAGESRVTRIREFHEENETPVVGLREGALLRVEGRSVRLLGCSGARLFRRDEIPVEYEPGAVMDFLLQL